MPIARRTGVIVPDRMWVSAPGVSTSDCRHLAALCASRAQSIAPKVSGAGARGIKPISGDGFFGLSWDQTHLWYVEEGTAARTMRSLAGRIIPMWLPDPLGRLHREYPKNETRVTVDGRHEVLIFRRVAKIGQTKNVIRRDSHGRLQVRSKPASYPGAAGRINLRQFPDFPNGTGNGRIMSTIERPHVGVRWRHPGIVGKHFMAHSITSVCQEYGIGAKRINATFRKQ
jgi:hypothetical protein